MIFADDSIFFIKANEDNARALRTIVRRYSVASRKKINLEKSCLQFGATTSEATKRIVGETLGIMVVENTGKYLGLPTNWGR